jgi:hypothetical protein
MKSLILVEDLDLAKEFAALDDLCQAMHHAGVSDKPDVFFFNSRG